MLEHTSMRAAVESGDITPDGKEYKDKIRGIQQEDGIEYLLNLFNGHSDAERTRRH